MSEQVPFFEPEPEVGQTDFIPPPSEGSFLPESPKLGRSSRTKKQTPLPSDRVPPHSIEAEQGLLAAIITDGGNILAECQANKITIDSFFLTAHQIIFDAITRLSNTGIAIDEITLSEQLRTLGKLEDIGGIVYINQLTASTATTAHVPHWIEIIKEKFYRRKLIRTATMTVERAFQAADGIGSLLEDVEKAFFSISQDRIQESAQNTGQRKGGIVEKTLSIIQTMIQNRGAIAGVPTGFKALDQMTFGFHPGQMIVVAARPGMGKTSIALNFIEAALFDKNFPRSRNVLMFSLEMTAEDLVQRLLASHSRVNLRDLQRGFGKAEHFEQLSRSAKEYQEKNLFIDDIGGQTIMEIRAKARRIHARTPLDLIVIDYLQLINGTDSRVPREQQIAEASRSIKAMAKEFGVPIIALAQLNRKSEDGERAPRPSDLRESGSIEQDADVIMLIDIKRGRKGNSPTEEEEDKQRRVIDRTLIIAKQRNGPTGDIPLHFISNITRFETPAQEGISEPNL